MTDIDYDNKVFLAPMVRIGTLPFRLTALEYGADLVWSEELVDKRVIGSVRKYNPVTKTIEYWKGDKLTFSTHEKERGRIIFQLGTADPDLALQAALTVKQDVAGIDVNCGCPKMFSVQGGMGAALLTDPDRLEKILKNLVQNVGLPVTCKIRLLDKEEDTVKLVKMIESTGVKALTVHCRTKETRSSVPANWEGFKAIKKAVTTIPVAVNGDVMCYQDIAKIKAITGANSCMIARGAQYNPSAFRKEGLLPFDEVVRTYIKKCVDLRNIYQNTKYVLLSMSTDPKFTKSTLYRNIQSAKSTLALCEAFGLESYYHEVEALHASRAMEAEAANAEEAKENEEQQQTKETLHGKHGLSGEQDIDEKGEEPAERQSKKLKV
ncbi:hypothetical protein BCR43DRAFT_479014 [Syncephalastrum racemosum]|uniref:tRNA-dihydrouridine synthase n=1 Tax=Syncephalastrum racemosum TaxID=13706 RepID=A0A1X2H2C9_SYNRA|nr:hypothetical protein BCR43DRAFT_479014 [Syncephalastrum racemosum]